MKIHNLSLITRHARAFTLVEMLIVIVIIGILAAALIPRLVGVQVRSRDVARTTDLRDISSAIDLYAIDHGGGYPLAFNPTDYNTTVHAPHQYLVAAQDAPTSRLLTQLTNDQKGTIAAIGEDISSYITAIPSDPRAKGVKAVVVGDCSDTGDTYAYHTPSDGSSYTVTARMQSGKGNTNNCRGVIVGEGGYHSVGVDLVYGQSQQVIDTSCFGFSNGIITSYRDDCTKDVILPSSIGGSPVTAVGQNAFDSKGIASVIVPEGITSIGPYAFASNNISSLMIQGNGTVSIEGAAFLANSIASVTLHTNVSYIPQPEPWVPGAPIIADAVQPSFDETVTIIVQN